MENTLDPAAEFYRQGYDKKSGEVFKDGKPRKVRFESIKELLREIEERAKNGHTTYPQDDPKQLTIGVMDETANQWLRIGIRDLKNSYGELTEERIKFIRECFNTKEGKDILFKRN
jgi:hypothetical protein